MSELIKDMEFVKATVSDEELVSMIVEVEDKCELSHGSHNQHSSSKEY